MEEILVDQEGYNQFIEELEKLKQTSMDISSAGSEVYKDAVGDGWHDNFAFEEIMREGRTIAAKINKMHKDSEKLKIIKKKKKDYEYINIGDTFEVEIEYSPEDIEKQQLTLTGKYLPDINNEISLNSPIGRAVYNHKINSTCEYYVNGNKIKLKILRKI